MGIHVEIIINSRIGSANKLETPEIKFYDTLSPSYAGLLQRSVGWRKFPFELLMYQVKHRTYHSGIPKGRCSGPGRRKYRSRRKIKRSKNPIERRRSEIEGTRAKCAKRPPPNRNEDANVTRDFSFSGLLRLRARSGAINGKRVLGFYCCGLRNFLV